MRQKVLTSCMGIICLFFLFGMKSEAATGINFLKEDPTLAVNEAVITGNEGSFLLYDKANVEANIVELTNIPENTIGFALTFQIQNFDLQPINMKYLLTARGGIYTDNAFSSSTESSNQEELIVAGDGKYILVFDSIKELQGQLESIDSLFLSFYDEKLEAFNTASEMTLELISFEYLTEEVELTYIVTGSLSEEFLFEEGSLEEGFVIEEGFVVEEGLEEATIVYAEETNYNTEQDLDSIKEEKSEEKPENAIISYLLLGAGILLVFLAIIFIVVHIVRLNANKK